MRSHIPRYRAALAALATTLAAPHLARAQDAAAATDASSVTAVTPPVDAAAAASSTAAPPPVAADPLASPAADALTLRDGTVLRGRVTALEVGQRVVLALADGTTREVPWREITSAEGPAFRSASVPSPQSPPPPPRRAPYDLATTDLLRPAPGQVPLVVESDGAPQSVGVTLAVEETGTGFESALLVRRRMLCRTPCSLYVRPGTVRLFTTAPGLVEGTSTVEVPAEGTRVRLFAASRGARSAAIGLTTAGGLGVLASGITMLVLGGLVSPLTLGIVAAASFGGSVLIAVPGVILFATNPTGIRAQYPLESTAAAATASVVLAPVVVF